MINSDTVQELIDALVKEYQETNDLETFTKKIKDDLRFIMEMDKAEHKYETERKAWDASNADYWSKRSSLQQMCSHTLTTLKKEGCVQHCRVCFCAVPNAN